MRRDTCSLVSSGENDNSSLVQDAYVLGMFRERNDHNLDQANGRQFVTADKILYLYRRTIAMKTPSHFAGKKIPFRINHPAIFTA
jgi:hypothetical protein